MCARFVMKSKPNLKPCPSISFCFFPESKGCLKICEQGIKGIHNKNILKYLSLYLLQMTTLGKVASSIGSVEESRLVDTVEVLNWFTVLCNFEWKSGWPQKKVIWRCTWCKGRRPAQPWQEWWPPKRFSPWLKIQEYGASHAGWYWHRRRTTCSFWKV